MRLPGIQAVLDKGYVDENAIGIQGHSWGGYQRLHGYADQQIQGGSAGSACCKHDES